VIFVDSNIPMYLIGEDHPHRADAIRYLERLVDDRERLVTDAEVLQEILRRYRAIARPDAVQPAFDALLGIVEDVFPIERADVERARDILLGRFALSARDVLHVAVMERHHIDRILTFDRGYDEVPGISRLG
jgi:hypothetical protein